MGHAASTALRAYGIGVGGVGFGHPTWISTRSEAALPAMTGPAP